MTTTISLTYRGRASLSSFTRGGSRMKTLRLTKTTADAMKMVVALSDTNEKTWAGFDAGDVRIYNLRWTRRPNSDLVDFIVEFEERPLGTPKHFGLDVFDGAEVIHFDTHKSRDFAALFGDNPQFECPVPDVQNTG